MSTIDLDEVYTDELALSIYDESVRFRRKVRSSVLTSAAIVLLAALFFGLLVLTQALQRDLPTATENPDLVMIPASGSLLTAAFSALLAVILAVWFSPNTFRLGASESPSTIARELSTRLVIASIARLCVLASMGLSVWAFVSSAATLGPQQVDVVRMLLPVLLGLGLAFWAAAAEVRIGEVTNRKLVWAQHTRAAERLDRIVAGEKGQALSKRSRIVQRVIAFGGVPVVVWFVGLLIVPAPSPAAGVARLAMAAAVTVVGYFALRDLTYRLVGRQTAAAVSLVFMLLVFGVLLWATTASAALQPDATEDALHLAPIARSMLFFTVLTLSGPFVLLSVLTVRRPFFGRWRGLIFDAVMKRYAKELVEAKEQVTTAAHTPAGAAAPSRGQKKTPFAWAAVAALVPILPFNFMFAALALRLTQGKAARGRGWAMMAIVIGVLVTAVVICFLIYVALSDPTLVYCKPGSTDVCFKS